MMNFKFSKIWVIFIFILITKTQFVFAEIIKDIKVKGNDRISDETIIMFSAVRMDENVDANKLNQFLKNLYSTNFFEDVSLNLKNNVLTITVKENPIIQKVLFEGIKAKKINKLIEDNISLKSRSSYNELVLNKDIDKIKLILKEIGYYFPNINTYLEVIDDNKVNLTYQIDLGEKAKIRKISFVGDKKFKEKKLKSIIISEENKFWKFITNKKFVNENVISLDKRLLKNFYLNRGYYNVKVDTSFAKLINKEDFELIYNIQANEKFYFNDLNISLPDDFEKNNFEEIYLLFKKLKGKPYSINQIEDILELIDKITLAEQYQSISSSVEEVIIGQQINLNFIIEETKNIYVEKINILGNNVTKETVIRNQLEIDEGDPYIEILAKKSINNLKSLNFFKIVTTE